MFAVFISKAFVFAQLPGAAVGFIAGAFCPAVLRKVKALFVKDANALKSDVQSAVSKAAGAVASASSDVAKKL